MENPVYDLVEITRFYGSDKSYVIAGGGNTSYKNGSHIWVKSSGTAMKDIREENFVVLNREKLQVIYSRQYSKDSFTREAEVKEDLQKACEPGSTGRPSVETSLHDLIRYSFVVHTHPSKVNGVLCSLNSEETIKKLFGEKALYIPYTDPGYILFSLVRDKLTEWRENHDADPKMIFLQNHGVFVAADSTGEIKAVYSNIDETITREIRLFPDITSEEITERLVQFMPALRMIFSEDTLKVARIRNNRLARHFTSSEENFLKISLPFIPDQIVYCKARPVYIDADEPESIINQCSEKVLQFRTEYGYMPRMAGIKGYGIIAFDNNIKSAETEQDIFEDWMQVSYLSENFGGPHFLSDSEIAFIDNWEVENYRRKVADSASVQGRIKNKIAIVTGGAQGFGEGIVKGLMLEGANVVIADLNVEKGRELASQLNNPGQQNEGLFCETDVTSEESVKKMIAATVASFGGADILISNAGVLRAGGLDDMTLETFEFITRVNYTGYFVCARHVSAIMKLQASHKRDYFTDIIQINSKSGLKGSNRNFAYAGSKFGSIGLTQSFALELMPWNIKVNSVCPGNFFEGPLWSDPEKGLFVQYLKAGKVPGARTIDDVKAHYEKQVPAGRGCRVEDVMKAILYLIDQEYETGQALPVTGGQEMLR
jgi:NAD(P)-dependent dehydrogenase (short-subunit alcohol dehydrogenase family)/rhamnose utilization protein RhaD (predicted bifunctional aldolase and dehydrogenase)